MFKLTPIILASSILLPQASAAWNPLGKEGPGKHLSEEKVISAWNPWKGSKQCSETGASKKTIIALERFKKIPKLESFFSTANAYAVFPNIAKAGMFIGGAHGKGEVFQKCKAIGAATLTQLSVGFQLGGQAFSQIIFFKERRDTDRFTQGNFEFGASASAALISEGAATEAPYSDGIAVLTLSKGGLMYEASIGGQKFSFTPYN